MVVRFNRNLTCGRKQNFFVVDQMGGGGADHVFKNSYSTKSLETFLPEGPALPLCPHMVTRVDDHPILRHARAISD